VTAFRYQALMEIRRIYRHPRFVVFTYLTPVVLFLFFLWVYGDHPLAEAGSNRRFFLVGMSAYGVMGAAVGIFGARVAMERQRGWFRLLRTTPLPLWAVFAAKLAALLVASFGIAVLMLIAGMIVNGPGILSPGAWLGLGAILVLGSLPFGALALTLGYWVDAESAYVVSLAIYFSLGILGGLFLPLQYMPDLAQRIGRALPSYDYARLGWDVVAGRSLSWASAGWLVVYLAAFLIVAALGYRRDQSQQYR
jgi:ABC-2 type transport system permease protein